MPRRTAGTLTAPKIKRARHQADGPEQQYLWDSIVPGLGVQLLATGSKSWVFRYRIDGTARRVSLGPVAALPIDAARERALQLGADVRSGLDPIREKRKKPKPRTLADVHREYIATAYFKSRSPDFQHNFASAWRRHISQQLGKLDLAKIARADIRERINAICDEGKEGAAQGVLTHLRVLFAFAIDREMIEHSPADKVSVKRTGTGRRDIWLKTDEDIKAAWYLDAPIQVRAMVRWCLLTGCRRDEAREAAWNQIENEVWTVPDTKSGAPLVLPITAVMRAVLDEQAGTFQGTPWIFPSTTSDRKPIPRGSSDYVLRQATKGAWMWHALRHTVESHLAEMGVGAEVRDLILNHRGRGGVGERYRHGLQLDTKREGLEKWHSRLVTLCN